MPPRIYDNLGRVADPVIAMWVGVADHFPSNYEQRPDGDSCYRTGLPTVQGAASAQGRDAVTPRDFRKPPNPWPANRGNLFAGHHATSRTRVPYPKAA